MQHDYYVYDKLRRTTRVEMAHCTGTCKNHGQAPGLRCYFRRFVCIFLAFSYRELGMPAYSLFDVSQPLLFEWTPYRYYSHLKVGFLIVITNVLTIT